MTHNNIILVHGAWHGSWCWSHIVPIISQSGYNIKAPDLPSHYNNADISFENISLTTYVDYLSNIIMKENGKTILIGHSMAGIVISQVAENIPNKIDKLIYIAGFIPDYNGSLIDEEQKSTTPTVTLSTLVDKSNYSISFSDQAKVKNLFYNCCDENDVNYALSNIQPQALKPFLDKVSLSKQNFGQTPKTYIECSKDNAILIQDQKRMHSKENCKILTLENADHSPFFSSCKDLSKLIITECQSN